MKSNESTVDRFLRVVLGLAIGGFFFSTQHPAWALLAAVPLVTGIVGFCPIYRVLGWSTRRPTQPIAP